MTEMKLLTDHLQQTPFFREPTSSEVDGACFHADSGFNLLTREEQNTQREAARRWLRAWKAQASVKWLEAPAIPTYKPRRFRNAHR
jgi:hypothetical protein